MRKRTIAFVSMVAAIMILSTATTVWSVDNGYNQITLLGHTWMRFEGDVSMPGNFLGNSIYGGMYNYSDAGLAIGIASSETYYNITNLKQVSTNGVTFLTGTQAQGGSRMIVGYAGMYQLSATIAASCGLNGEYGFAIMKNYIDPETVGNCYSRLTGTGNVRPTSITCLMQLAVGDTVSLVMDDEKNPAQDCTVQTVNMVMERVGS